MRSSRSWQFSWAFARPSPRHVQNVSAHLDRTKATPRRTKREKRLLFKHLLPKAGRAYVSLAV